MCFAIPIDAINICLLVLRFHHSKIYVEKKIQQIDKKRNCGCANLGLLLHKPLEKDQIMLSFELSPHS